MSNDDRPLARINDISETRLWKSLDSISDRLSGIESKLTEVVRLEEKVSSHEQALVRYGNRLDNHDNRIHSTEIWQASYGDKSSIERLVNTIHDELGELKIDVEALKSDQDRKKGQRDVVKEIFKWTTTVLSGIVIYLLTQGN